MRDTPCSSRPRRTYTQGSYVQLKAPSALRHRETDDPYKSEDAISATMQTALFEREFEGQERRRCRRNIRLPGRRGEQRDCESLRNDLLHDSPDDLLGITMTRSLNLHRFGAVSQPSYDA